MRKSILAIAALLALSTAAPVAQAADTLRVPKTTWKQCGGVQTTFCLTSIAIQPVGTAKAIELVWVPSGTAAPKPPAPVVTDTATVTDTSTSKPVDTATPAATPSPTPTATTPAAPVTEQAPGGAAVSGMWTSQDWAQLGLPYAGIFVDVKTANEFVNTIFLNVVPVVQNASNATLKGLAAAGSVYPADLNPDITIISRLNVGNFVTGVTLGAAQNVTVDAAGDAGNRTFTIAGEPSRMPLASSVKDCSGEQGKAVANPIMMQAFIFPTNDTAGFGVEGVSGDMYVASNGLCLLSTPVWDEAAAELKWQAAAPHFAPDGTSINRGFYNAVIPAADAKLLWGLENANDAATALTVSVTDENGQQVASQGNISVKSGKIIIQYAGFQFSKPTIIIKKNPKYVPSKPAASPAASAASTAKAAVAKKVTITCVKGKVTKKVTAVKPTCPAGYKKK